jgi:hypothetical protein
VTAASTSIVLNSVSGLPTSVPFKVVLEPGQPAEEIVKVTAVAATTLAVVRGWDGTSATTHGAGTSVRHMMTAEDLSLSRAHEDSTTAHGATGAVVGATNAQTLSNKDLSSGTNTFPTALVTLTGAQSLTNKNLTDATNVFPASLATLTGAQTLTNKTLTSPVVNGMTGDTATFSGNITSANLTSLSSSVSTNTTNITSLGNAAVTQATGSAKRMHIVTGLDGTTDSSGYATFNHGAPFTPRVVQAVVGSNAAHLGYVISVGNISSTQVKVRFGNWSAGGTLNTLALNSNIALVCWE